MTGSVNTDGPGCETRLERAIPAVYAVLALILGSCYAALMPRLRVPDEVAHFQRAYAVSQGRCAGPPAVLRQMDWQEMEKEYPWVELSGGTTPGEMVELMRKGGWYNYDTVGAFAGANTYNCVAYTVSAAGILAGRMAGANPVTQMYLGRFANLLWFAGVVTLALAIASGYRLMLAAVALLPMTLHQAASLSADSFAISLGLLYCAWTLRMTGTGEKRRRVDGPLWLFAFWPLLALTKAALALAPLAVGIPLSRFGSRTRKWGVLVVSAALAATALLVWQRSSGTNIERVAAIRGEHGIGMEANLRFIIENPIAFLTVAWHTMAALGAKLAVSVAGCLGFQEVFLPWHAVWMSIACLTGAASTALWPIPKEGRLLAFGVFLAGVLATLGALWMFETPAADLAAAREFKPVVIHVFQGRHLLPFLFPLLLAFSCRLGRRLLPVAGILIIGGLAAVNVTALQSVRAHYAPQSASWRGEVGRLVRRPGNSPEDQKVYLIMNGEKRWVIDGRWITDHGYRWPEDVEVIPGEELERIPTGEPVR